VVRGVVTVLGLASEVWARGGQPFLVVLLKMPVCRRTGDVSGGLWRPSGGNEGVERTELFGELGSGWLRHAVPQAPEPLNSNWTFA